MIIDFVLRGNHFSLYGDIGLFFHESFAPFSLHFLLSLILLRHSPRIEK